MESIGIPRAMSWYYFFPYYLGFLRGLGVDPVLSETTGGRTLRRLGDCPTDEPCVSVKLAFAHAGELLDRGVDRLFIPVLSSVDPTSYCCPKLIGLPHMIRNGFRLDPQRLLAPRIDRRHSRDGGRASFFAAARALGAEMGAIGPALAQAERLQREFRELTVGSGLLGIEAIDRLLGSVRTARRRYDPQARFDPGLRIGLVGHSYVLYDGISHDVVPRLREHGTVLTPEMVDPAVARQALSGIWQGDRLWTFEAQQLGAVRYWLSGQRIDRLVVVMPFECGPASVIETMLMEGAARAGVPALGLTLDEHTAAIGLATRIEAFFDTCRSQVPRRGKCEVEPAVSMVAVAPTVGRVGEALNRVFSDLGVAVAPAPPVTRRTLELGLELSPEFMCLPLATTIGQMREALQAGANTLVMISGKGRCRLGWYAQLQEMLLREAGYRFRMIILDSPFPLASNWRPFARTVGEMMGVGWPRIAYAAWTAIERLAALERGEQLVREFRACEEQRGACDELYARLVSDLDASSTPGQVRACLKRLARQLSLLPRTRERSVVVRVVGEVYVVADEHVNLGLERILGRLEGVRVRVDRELTISAWLGENLLWNRQARRRRHQVLTAAHPYLPDLVGGHGMESVGLTALSTAEGVDGVVHVMPFTCMPEIVAQNIITRVAEDYELPTLSVVLSEQTGRAGLETRLEAFADVLAARRSRSGG